MSQHCQQINRPKIEMADEKWQKVREIFDSALRRQPEERRKFVFEVCGDDKTLLAEVESLLSSLDGADSFLETPIISQVGDIIQPKYQTLAPGISLSHYEIAKQIGMGGMGEVYLAQDKKLDRKVAVKILNKEFRRQESNLNRFVREAKAASALSHMLGWSNYLALDKLKSDPRWKDVARRMNLPQNPS
ncbi:MAG TPA: hypothetical protein VGC76_05030 [Pyrinomonadaceae bacterium]|jgi:hypothetical protein